MKKCFICLDEKIILSCRTCRHGLGGNCEPRTHNIPEILAGFTVFTARSRVPVNYLVCPQSY